MSPPIAEPPMPQMHTDSTSLASDSLLLIASSICFGMLTIESSIPLLSKEFRSPASSSGSIMSMRYIRRNIIL